MIAICPSTIACFIIVYFFNWDAVGPLLLLQDWTQKTDSSPGYNACVFSGRAWRSQGGLMESHLRCLEDPPPAACDQTRPESKWPLWETNGISLSLRRSLFGFWNELRWKAAETTGACVVLPCAPWCHWLWAKTGNAVPNATSVRQLAYSCVGNEKMHWSVEARCLWWYAWTSVKCTVSNNEMRIQSPPAGNATFSNFSQTQLPMFSRWQICCFFVFFLNPKILTKKGKKFDLFCCNSASKSARLETQHQCKLSICLAVESCPTSRSRGALSHPNICFSKSCSFQAFLKEKPSFWAQSPGVKIKTQLSPPWPKSWIRPCVLPKKGNGQKP